MPFSTTTPRTAPLLIELTPIQTALVGILAVAITSVGTWLVARTWKPGARELALVVQLQADGAALREELSELRNELAELRGAQAVTDGRLRVVTEYAWQLRADIHQLGYEPRPWPTEL